MIHSISFFRQWMRDFGTYVKSKPNIESKDMTSAVDYVRKTVRKLLHFRKDEYEKDKTDKQ